jgi:hypothetical protein
LDRSRDCSLIGRKGGADRGIVVDVLGHHVEHARKIHQRNKRRIKSLLLRCIRQCDIGESRVLRQPVVDIQDFLRIG